ncbi:hypothetical protein J2S71_000185 [Olsenella profusa DSM 13989]|uniref:DUF4125 family protein n=1 Tax=Olsenella profusa TaxID=138595 RepID=UPI00278A3522|nr:DUF4125 family protein [Olsenella profusa]MDP9858489.1 hypothetical protein [Olsenella profusa DSM 13989]
MICDSIHADSRDACTAFGTGFSRSERQIDMERLFSLPGVVMVLDEEGLGQASREDLCHLVALEWKQFDSVLGMNGRASCQDDLRQFFAYRSAQYLAFPHELVHPVLSELKRADDEGRNLIAEKYARMMRVTDPEIYRTTWARKLPIPSPVRKAALAQIRALLSPALDDAARELPQSHLHARPDRSNARTVSAMDYFLAEVEGYSLGTIYRLRDALGRQLPRENPIALSYVLASRLIDATEVSACIARSATHANATTSTE